MARSMIVRFADLLQRRPEWQERDGDRHVLVRGYSPLDNLIYGAIAAAVILAPYIIFLVTLP
ncbi:MULTISPECIES: hypothetical protein [Devosia]|uniref:hypothetical protein n=1 Tax=Devosia TaxID=46913 RepID=UPI000CE957D2|nr:MULTISPECIES: hypothetical protein [Devosia]AVF05544.1 hypothetical protein C4375_18830 [Devosia sp. I507]